MLICSPESARLLRPGSHRRMFCLMPNPHVLLCSCYSSGHVLDFSTSKVPASSGIMTAAAGDYPLEACHKAQQAGNLAGHDPIDLLSKLADHLIT